MQQLPLWANSGCEIQIRNCLLFHCISLSYISTCLPLTFSCAGSWLLGCYCQSVHSFGPDWNISTTFGSIAVTFCTDTNNPHWMNPIDFGEPPGFSSCATATLTVVILSVFDKKNLQIYVLTPTVISDYWVNVGVLIWDNAKRKHLSNMSIFVVNISWSLCI